METRYYHGDLSPNEIGHALVARFDHGNLRAQQLGTGHKIIVQISTRQHRVSGGDTAMSVVIEKIEDGVSVSLGKQQWLGVAASLGQTVISTLFNPWSIISRLDDLAQDYSSLNIPEEVWEVIEEVARSAGASFELSERLRRTLCEYCRTANPVGEPSCIACGAPLGESQPDTCPNCGFAIDAEATFCPNCGHRF